MSTVYKATQSSIGRTVAIKVMPAHLLNDPTFLQRFKQEVEVIAALQHPRVMPVFDYGELDNRPYIVMAHIDGGTLTDRIKAGPMDTDEVLRIMQQVAEGLTHAHNHGIIHRDFKPGNVLLDRSGNAYLADFGIAKITGQGTANLTGSGVIGTPAYMAPEMAQEGEVSPAVDIYAMGVALFEMLAGKYPFDADTAIRLIMAHVRSPVPDVRDSRPELPPTVGDVIAKAMAKTPEERYDTPLALVDDLRRALNGEPVTAPPRPRSVEDNSWDSTIPDLPTAQPQPTEQLDDDEEEPTPPIKQRGGLSLPLVLGVTLMGLLLCSGAFVVFGGGRLLSPAPDDDTAAKDDEAISEEFDTEASASADGLGELEVINNSDQTLCGLFITASEEAGSWGPNQLQTELGADDTYTITGIPPARYNVRVDDCNDRLYHAIYRASIEGSKSWTVNAASVTVINETPQPICEVYIAPAAAAEWGSNVLTDGERIEPGSEVRYPIAEAEWDLRAVPCDVEAAREVTLQNANISGQQVWRLQQ
jgi:serine/threonine-protein kinase